MKRICLFLCLTALILLALTSKGIRAQEVWFPWLDHVSRIQSEWTQTQKEAFSIWNNISKFQDFGEYESRINEVLKLIENMQQQQAEDKSKYSRKYPRFFQLSDQYIKAMKDVVNQLKMILKRLKEKSENLNAYSLKQYQKDLERYDELLQTYRTLGKKMNDEFGKIK
jgi:Zn-dependent M32 family carboxypeptidase